MFGPPEHQWHIYGLHVVCPNREQKRSDRGFLLERWRRTRRKLRPRWNSTEMEPVRFKIFLCIWEFVVRSASRSSRSPRHQILMHGRSLMEAGCTTEAPPYTEEDLDADSVHLGQVSVCRLLSPFPPPSPTVKAPLASFVKSGLLGLKAVYTVKEPVMFGHRKAPKRHDTPRESPLYKREGCPLRLRHSSEAASRSGQGKPSRSPALWAQSAM